MKFINIKETIEDKHSLFNIKRFKYKGLTFEFIIKTIDLKNIRINKWNEIKKNWKGPIVLENTKEIKSIERINTILKKDHIYQNRFFKIVSSLFEYPNNIIITFNFNSSEEIQKLMKNKNHEIFFDLYYGYSNFWLFIPNVKPKKYVFISKNKRKLTEIINAQNYIKFVDTVFEILNYKNSKPIFVPISLKFSNEDIKKILTYYLKKEYFYIWVDFEGSAVNERSLGTLRNIYRIIEDFGRKEDVLLYFTNIKREIISHVKDERTPASDVLSPLIGGNIIGVNREPQRISDEKVYSKKELRSHKIRILDKESYYYVKLINNKIKIKNKIKLLRDQKEVGILNNIFLHQETKILSNNLLEGKKIKDYISTKTMLKEHPKGVAFYQKIFNKRKLEKITKWF